MNLANFKSPEIPESLYLLFKEYVEKTAANTFVYGDKRKMNEKLVVITEEEYPVLQLERPNIVVTDNQSGNQMLRYSCVVNAFAKYSTMGESEENDATERMAEQVTLNILTDILKDLNHRDGEFEFELDGPTIDPIMDGYLPNHLGWQMVVNIGVYANMKLC